MAAAEASRCDFQQNLVTDKTYYAYNKEYPKNYKGSIACRWGGYSVTGSKITISCTVAIPSVRKSILLNYFFIYKFSDT